MRKDKEKTQYFALSTIYFGNKWDQIEPEQKKEVIIQSHLRKFEKQYDKEILKKGLPNPRILLWLKYNLEDVFEKVEKLFENENFLPVKSRIQNSPMPTIQENYEEFLRKWQEG